MFYLIPTAHAAYNDLRTVQCLHLTTGLLLKISKIPCSDLLLNSSDITIKYTQLQVKLIYQQKVLSVFDMQQSERCVIRIRVIMNDLSI